MKLDTVYEITDWIRKDTADIGQRNAPCIEVLGALRATCQLFLRNRSRTCIERSGSQWAQVASSLSKEARQTQAAEQLQIDDRIRLVTAGMGIIAAWPDSFIDFANEAGISRAHFNGAECLQPPWMTEIVNSRLGRQNRSVTDAVLETAISSLTLKLDRNPTKTELRRHLAWQGEKGLGKFFIKRTEATSAEWRYLLNAITETERRFAFKPRSLNSFACEMAVLLLCLMNDVQINSFADIQRQGLCRMLASHREKRDPSEDELRLLSMKIEGLLLGIPNRPELSGRISTRQVRKRLHQLLAGLPIELMRDIRVFIRSRNTTGKTLEHVLRVQAHRTEKDHVRSITALRTL